MSDFLKSAIQYRAAQRVEWRVERQVDMTLCSFKAYLQQLKINFAV